MTSNSESANQQARCTDSKRNTPGQSMEDEHTLLPCPFCGGEPAMQHFNISPYLQGRIICACGAEMRQGRYKEEEIISAWNTSVTLGSETCRLGEEAQHD